MEEKFAQIAQKFASLRPFVTLNDVDLVFVRNWLLELDELDYNVHLIGTESRAKLLVNQLCSIIPIDDGGLIEGTAVMIIRLVRKQSLRLEGRTLMLAIEWCLSALNYGTTDDTWMVPYARVLQAIDAVVRGNPHVDNQRSAIFALIQRFPHILVYCDCVDELHRHTLEVPLVRAMQAILDIKCDKSDDIPQPLLDCLVPFFVTRLAGHSTASGPPLPEGFEPLAPLDYIEDDYSHVTLLRYSLAGVRRLLETRTSPLPPNALTRMLLGVCRTYMTYELNGVPFLPPGELHPIAFSPAEPEARVPPAPVAANRMPRQRRRRHVSRLPQADITPRDRRFDPELAQRDANMLCMTATFGHSPPYGPSSTSYNPYIHPPETDARPEPLYDFDSLRSKTVLYQSYVRLEALHLLQVILNNIDKQVLCEHFISFMQTKSVSTTTLTVPPSGNNLLTCMLKDPSTSCRLAAHLCLQTMLTEGKAMLLFADHRPVPGQVSFIPRCYTMANIVTQLHHCLCLGMNEPSYTILTQLLKTTALVVRATYYEWLGSGLCAKVVRNVKQLVDHNDISVQVGALTVIGCLLSHNTIQEIEDAFVDSNEGGDGACAMHDERGMNVMEGGAEAYAVFEQTRDHHPAVGVRPWLIDQCFYNLRGENNVPAPVKIESLQIIGAMCERYFTSLIMPFIQSVSRALLAAFVDQDNLDVLHHAIKAMQQFGDAMNTHYQLRGCLDQSLTIWQKLLEGPVADFTSSEHLLLRAGAADCIGAVGDHTFELLPTNLQLVCLTVLLSLAADPDTTVRSAAVRAIGILLLYNTVRTFNGYMLDASDVIVRAMKDTSVLVRVRASWGLGNLSDAMLQQNMQERNLDEDGFTAPVLLDPVINVAISGSQDQDKVRCNAVRALGNLLQLLYDANVDDQQRNQLYEGVDALLKCARSAGLMKARWNACYALGNVLKIPAVYQTNPALGVRLSMRIFFVLGCILTDCTNIKVRINAAMAVTSCTTRVGFGDNFLPLWRSLVNGLVTVENISDVNEYKHRDKLAIQTCVTLGHMTKLVVVDDLQLLADVVTDGADDLISRQVQRVYDRLPPENQTALIEADARLTALAGYQLTEQALSALRVLQPIFARGPEI